RHGGHRGGGGTCGLRAAAEVRAGAAVPADRCDRAARECAADRGALARGGPSRARPRHRHHEAGEPRLRDAGNAHRIPRERGIGVVAAVRGALGGFFAASSLSALLQPIFGWRIMWFLNLPTGLILVALSPLIPESARFLQQMGRADLARATLARFGVELSPASVVSAAAATE